MSYDVGKDPYLDPSTGVLKNSLGILSVSELEQAEARITNIAIAKVIEQTQVTADACDMALFLDIHKQIFGSMYDWAGKLRTVEVSKGATSFARVQYLETNLREFFRKFADDNYGAASSREEFIAKLAHYYGELNVLHPFREGNGRTIRTFLSLLADAHGYYIAWDRMTAEENMRASVASYNGDDGLFIEMLRRIICGA